jgi:hypothetical protein
VQSSHLHVLASRQRQSLLVAASRAVLLGACCFSPTKHILLLLPRRVTWAIERKPMHGGRHARPPMSCALLALAWTYRTGGKWQQEQEKTVHLIVGHNTQEGVSGIAAAVGATAA